MADNTQTLDQVIDAEVEKLDATKEVEKVEKTEVEDTTEDTTEDTEDEPVVKEVLSDEQREAIRLYEALKDPKQQGDIMKFLANQLGLEISTKAQKQEVSSALEEVLKESLGEEFSFLAPKLKGLETYLETRLDARFKALESERELEKITLETNNAVDKLYNLTKGDAKNYEARIHELMEEIQPGPNSDPFKYVNRLYNIAKNEQVEKDNKVSKVNRVAENASDVGSRIANNGIRSSEVSTPKPGGKLTLDESMALAIEQLTKG